MTKLLCLVIGLFVLLPCFSQTVSGNSSLCGGNSDVLSVTGYQTGSTFQWQYSSTGNNPWNNASGGSTSDTYSATAEGYYRVAIKDGTTTTNTTAFQVVNSTKPTVTFTIDKNNACSGTNVAFTSTVTPGTPPYTYAWNFADGNTSSAPSPSHAFTYLGCSTATINNTLTVTDKNGCQATASNNMTTLEKPDVELSDVDGAQFKNCDNSPTPENPNYTIHVQNASSSCITDFSLDWGDGNKLTGLTASSFPLTHTYTELGAFNLSVTGNGTNGCSNSKVYVVANQSNPAGGLATLGTTTGLCAPADIPFLISTWENNSPGTSYILDFGDNNSITLYQPLKETPGIDTVHHVYTTSSCANGFGTYIAQLTAINACSTTPYTAGNIQINTKAQAAFTAPITGCVNQNICFTDQTKLGYVGSSCSKPIKYSWDFGDPSSPSNTSNDQNPCHVYTSPGTYTVTLVDSNRCGLTAATQTVCVLPVPIPSFTLDQASGCGPLAVTTTNTSNTLTGCAVSQYNWTVTYNSGLCGTSSYTFTNSTTASSVSPSFSFANAGTYTVQLSITNPCGTYTTSKDITVIQPPQVKISSISDACGFASISPTATLSGCNLGSPTYAWSFPGGSILSSTSAIPGTITYSSPSNYTITLQVTNSCGTTTDTKSFSVNALPVITVPSSSAYCSGITTGTFAMSSNPAANITWTNDNTKTGLNNISGNGDIPPFTTANNTSSTQVSNINATATVGGCTGSNSFAITVYPNLAAPTVTSPVNYCINQTAMPLTATGGTGNTLNWYTTATGGTALVGAPTPGTTTVGITNYYVSQESSLGNCESPRALITVNVNATPTFTATASSPTACGTGTGSITLNGLTATTTYTVTYTKDGANQSATLTADGNGVIIISNLPSGLYEHIVVTASNCPSAEAGPFTLTDPTPPATPIVTNTGPICSGGTLQLSASTTTTGVATWSWSGQNGFSATSPNPTIPNVTTAASGDYFATVTINNCKSAPGKTTVIINPTPATPILTSNSPVCTGNTLTFTDTPNGNGVTYNWTGPNSFTSTDQSPSIPNINLAAGGDYTVKATLGNCSSQSTISVVVNETPAIANTLKTDPTQCASATGNITLTGLSASRTYTVTYTKNATPASQTITADGSGNVIINALTAATYSNIQVGINNCSSNIIGPIILNDPNPPPIPSISSNSPLCAGATLNLTATSGNTGTYTWSGPNSFASNDQNPVITNVAAANQGTYQVTITVNNCTSLPASTDIVVNPLAAAPTAISPVEYCINTAAVPLTATANNGSTLNWFTVAVGGTTLPSAPTPSTTTVGSVSYYVSQTTTSGCEGARTPIEVITHPDAKAEFLPIKTIGCAPFVITSNVINLQSHPEANATYEWYANDVLIGSGTAFPGYTIQNDNDSIIIKLKTISLFGCKDDSASQKFYTYQLPKPAFVASQTSGCGPLTITFTNNTPQPQLFNFKWIFGNRQTSTEINPQPVLFATNPTYGDTIYHVVLQAYTICDTITASTDILVKSKPKALFSPDKTNGCSPMTVHFTNVSKGFGTGYQWFFGDGATTTTTDASPVEHTYTTGIQDTFYAKMVATNECGTDTAMYAIVVSPNKVKLHVAVNGDQTTGCAPHQVQFINTSTGANTFQWNFGDGNTLNTTKNIDTVTHAFLTGGTYSVTLFASNGCSDTTTVLPITVFDKPTADYSATPLSACIGDTISFTNQSQNYDGLQWLFGDAQRSTLTNPQHAYTAAGAYNAMLIAQRQYANGTVCSDTATKSISIVDHLPGAFTATATVSTCVPFTVTFTNTILPSVLTTWNFGDGSSDTGDVVTHTFVLPNTYTVTMQAKHPAGCLYQSTKTITANGPAGTIRYTPGYVCNNTPVRFEASTTNTDSIRWDFGDGLFQTTTSLVVYHSYNKPGIFVPSAELISGNNCRVIVSTKDSIKVDYVTAGFTAQQDAICGTTTVHYNDTSHAFFGLNQWLWKLGDGTTSSLQNPMHGYTATGTLPIQLIAISNSGCADTANVSLFVKVNDKPVASINGSANACDVLPVAYKANVSSIDSVSLYQWNITPAASYNTPTIVHTYPSAGNYTVQLIAGTVYGCYDTASLAVNVKTTPSVSASAGIVICNSNTTPLTVTGNAQQYVWQPGATLSCSTCANPLAAPVSTTQYYVTGTASNGCSRTDSVLITVIQPFTLTVSEGDSICIGQSKQLTVSGTDYYTWSPAATLDDSTSQHPVATPLASTIYSVTGTDAHHCFTDTKTVVVGVGQYPVISLGKDTLLSTGTIFPLHSVVTEGGPIKNYTWSLATDLSCSTCIVPDANIKRPVCYSVDATNYFGCSGKDTVCIKVFCEQGQLFIANIFTPDGDGINDKLVVQGKGISSIRSFRIFNRWGQVVFEKSGFPPNDASSGWDGRVNGNLASQDVYVYTCEVVCDDGTVYTYKGNVALVK